MGSAHKFRSSSVSEATPYSKKTIYGSSLLRYAVSRLPPNVRTFAHPAVIDGNRVAANMLYGQLGRFSWLIVSIVRRTMFNRLIQPPLGAITDNSGSGLPGERILVPSTTNTNTAELVVRANGSITENLN